jgi:hypothetical protein
VTKTINGPRWTAVGGALVVTLLLLFPIRTFAPGDHEKTGCGNALSIDLRSWPGGRDEESRRYFEAAFRSCTSQRVDRLAQSVAVVSLTVVLVTLLSRRRSPGSVDDVDRGARGEMTE